MDREWEVLATFIGEGRCDECGELFDNLMEYEDTAQVLCDGCAEMREADEPPNRRP